MNQKIKVKDVLTIGFAVFAIFFGAGNLIFPTYLGLEAQTAWMQGFASFSVSDIGMAMIALIMVVKCGSSAASLFEALGKKLAVGITGVCVLCLGPFIAIPRTCATTYEMSVASLFPGFDIRLFSALFFAVVLLLTIRPNSVIDLIGNLLTPVLLAVMAILIIKGIVSPIGPITGAAAVPVVKSGFLAGYQTMDCLGAGIISSIVIKSIHDKGYKSKETCLKVTVLACIVAGIGLFLTYGGLCYLGATAKTIEGSAAATQTQLVMLITHSILGDLGSVLLAILVLFACMTTAVGLTTACADFLAEITNGRISYPVLVALICVFDAILANVGTAAIISVAGPALEFLYPLILSQILMKLIDRGQFTAGMYKAAAAGAVICASVELAGSLIPSFQAAQLLPLHSIGLSWVPFSLIFILMYLGIKVSQKKAVPAQS